MEDMELRKKTFKRLCSKWHPDKNLPIDAELATDVFQYAGSLNITTLDVRTHKNLLLCPFPPDRSPPPPPPPPTPSLHDAAAGMRSGLLLARQYEKTQLGGVVGS